MGEGGAIYNGGTLRVINTTLAYNSGSRRKRRCGRRRWRVGRRLGWFWRQRRGGRPWNRRDIQLGQPSTRQLHGCLQLGLGWNGGAGGDGGSGRFRRRRRLRRSRRFRFWCDLWLLLRADQLHRCLEFGRRCSRWGWRSRLASDGHRGRRTALTERRVPGSGGGIGSSGTKMVNTLLAGSGNCCGSDYGLRAQSELGQHLRVHEYRQHEQH